MEVGCAINLSEEALDYILRKTRPMSKTRSSLHEYFRVRGVVLWLACQGEYDLESAREVEKLVDTTMPFAEKDLYKVGVIGADTEITWLPSLIFTDSDHEKLRHLLSEAGRKRSVERLLVNINWSRIPAVLLAKTFQPLRLLPSSTYVEILENHAIQNAVRPNCEWIHQDVYATETSGFAIRKSKDGPGCAMCQVKACSESEVLKWRLHLDVVGSKKILLGVACGGHSLSRKVMNGTLACSGEAKLVMQVNTHKEPRNGQACGSNSGGYAGGRRGSFPSGYGTVGSNQSNAAICDILAYGQDSTQVFSSPMAVLFTCSQKERWCTASVDGVGDFSTVENLPPGNIFPLVDLGKSAGPRVRIALEGGFTIL